MTLLGDLSIRSTSLFLPSFPLRFRKVFGLLHLSCVRPQHSRQGWVVMSLPYLNVTLIWMSSVPQMVLVGKQPVKKQDMQGCSCVCPVVPIPVADTRQVQTEQNFNCLSKRHHCNTCFKSQGNKCQSYKLSPVFCQIIVSRYALYLKVTLTSIFNIYALGTARWGSKLLGFWELDVLLISLYLLFVIKGENKVVSWCLYYLGSL